MIETGLIIFLSYSTLLMRQLVRSGMGRDRGLLWAIGNIFSAANFMIAAVAALIGCALVELLRKKL